MNWTESTPLSIANLNSLESRIAAALAEVTAGKTSLYNAIVAKGITPGSQAFADLVTAIQTTALVKTSDATAIAAQLLINATAYVNGVKITGSMPNRAGDTACLASSVSGTTLKLRASQGYRDGTDDNVTITDANWVEGNIPNGLTVFGKTGTNTNKKWATGTVATTYENDIQGTGVQPYNIFTVSGLAFTPSHVIIIPKTNNFSWSVFITNSYRAQLYLELSQPMSSKAARMDIDSSSSYAKLQISGTSFSLVTYIQNSGLIGTTVYRNCNGGSFDWYAYE